MCILIWGFARVFKCLQRMALKTHGTYQPLSSVRTDSSCVTEACLALGHSPDFFYVVPALLTALMYWNVLLAFKKLFLLRKRCYRNIKCFVFQIVVNCTMSTVSGECPTNEASWMQRSTKFCSNSQEYHCLPTIFLNESVEICLTVKLLQRGTNIIKIVYTNNSS